MPSAAMTPCRHVGCPALVDSGYCEQHKPESPARRYDAERGSAASRGYDYRWQRFRAAFLRRHPVCVDCANLGRVTPATEPHHIRKLRDYPDLRLVESNLMALCKEHHTDRTAKGE